MTRAKLDELERRSKAALGFTRDEECALIADARRLQLALEMADDCLPASLHTLCPEVRGIVADLIVGVERETAQRCVEAAEQYSYAAADAIRAEFNMDNLEAK